MSETHEMKTLTLKGETFDSFPDKQARADVLKKLPLPAGAAEVGQYLRVLSVDKNGKITGVEAVDAPSGGSNSGGNVDMSGYVQSVNGVAPDENGNVEIAVSGEVTLPDNLVYYKPDSGDDEGEEESGTASGSTVAVTQVLTAGVEIAKITVDGEETTLYAPEASSGGGGSGGESAGIPGFTKVFSTTTTEEVGTITTDIDLSQYSEVFGFIRTLPADSTKSGHVVWTFDKSSNYAYIANSLNSTQERTHIIHLTKYASNLWFGDASYKIPSSNPGDKMAPCMVETSKIGSVGSWLGGVALKIGTTVEIYAR